MTTYLKNLGELWHQFEATVLSAADQNKVRARAKILRALIEEILDDYSSTDTFGAGVNYDEFKGYLRKIFSEINRS